MLERTRRKLDSMYRAEPQLGLDGVLHEIEGRTRISEEQGQILAQIHRMLRPELSVEIGCAFGFSSLFILDAMVEGDYGHHIAMDPYQRGMWKGIGVAAVHELGFGSRFDYVEQKGYVGMGDLERTGRRCQYVYIDGSHLFDAAMVDLYCADQLLNIGGIIAIDDLWMPALERLQCFIATNFDHYAVVDQPVDNLHVIQKRAWDERNWDHFVDF